MGWRNARDLLMWRFKLSPPPLSPSLPFPNECPLFCVKRYAKKKKSKFIPSGRTSSRKENRKIYFPFDPSAMKTSRKFNPSADPWGFNNPGYLWPWYLSSLKLTYCDLFLLILIYPFKRDARYPLKTGFVVLSLKEIIKIKTFIINII